ncbi:related to Glucoamylase precursor [Pseudozyma flocculosa]|uniref:glucan 1,4-alpha-glucosidase n=2 Tax=Pseudozyma flocculosa TaxID=84751 RepID=A0A5C3F471_9BASI|nr:related to Glucoamylase precursor [Pseudozyma flocculosa]
MVAIVSKRRASKPFVLLGSAGLALILVVLCAFSGNAEAASISRSLLGLKQELSKRTTTVSYAYNRMIANIGGASPSGSSNQVPGVPAGTVIAAPSTANPNYFYAWIRDAALTMKVVVSQGTLDRTLIENYIKVEKIHQQNSDGSASLGEPKFNPDGSRFTGPWGRPQNDGPALRASTLIAYAKRIGLSDPLVTNTLYTPSLTGGSLIKTDLEYVSHHWQDSSFDLWEEVNGQHFFNQAVSRRALLDGAKFATSLNDPGAASWYNQQAASIKTSMQSFWNSGSGYVTAYQGVGGRSGLDCAVMLGALRGWDTTTATAVDTTEFGPASDKILATHKKYVDSFRSLYGINKGAAAPAAVATGRYQEDVYDGVGTSRGNPWYICTLSSAEIINTAVSVFNSRGSITITSISLPFFQQFASGLSTGTFAAGSSQFNNIITGMKTMSKGFVDIVQSHSWTNGSLNEEFNRDTGFNQGARDLTWSYAAFVSNDGAANGQFLKV